MPLCYPDEPNSSQGSLTVESASELRGMRMAARAVAGDGGGGPEPSHVDNL